MLKLESDSKLNMKYLSIYASYFSVSFLPSAFSLNSFILLKRAVGFFTSLYSMVEVAGVHFRLPVLTSFSLVCFKEDRGTRLEFCIKNLRIC